MINENGIDKEKSLFFYFDLLNEKKYFLFFVIIFSLIFSYVYLQVRSNNYTIKYDFFVINKTEENKFISLNYFLIENGYDDTYNQKKLKSYFIEELKNLSILSKVFGSNDAAKEIMVIIDKSHIQLVSLNPELDIQKLQQTIREINLKVFDNIVFEVNEIMKGKVFNIERKISSTQEKFKILESKYLLEQEAHLNLLIENSKIAQQLGYKSIQSLNNSNNNAELSIEINNNPGSFNGKHIPLFYRGYEALDKEIEIIKKRDRESLYLFDPTIRELKSEIVKLLIEKEKFEKTLAKSIENLLPKKEVFEAVVMDKKGPKIILNSTKTYIVYLISLLFFVGISVSALVIRDAYSRYKYSKD